MPRRNHITVSHRGKAAIQCAGLCEPEAESSGEVVEDYENQVCRPAETEEVGATVPDADPVDGEFWVMPETVRKGARPVFDDEGTNVIVAFRYYSGGYYEI
ncbi:MAG: hypothetical protein ABI556_05920 [Gemmatimonadales bacterium]